MRFYFRGGLSCWLLCHCEGEKLKEDILLDKEKDSVTRHDKIFVTKTSSLEPARLRKHIKELHRLAQLMAEGKIIAKMKEIIELSK